jgi:hypothetical protein
MLDRPAKSCATAHNPRDRAERGKRFLTRQLGPVHTPGRAPIQSLARVCLRSPVVYVLKFKIGFQKFLQKFQRSYSIIQARAPIEELRPAADWAAGRSDARLVTSGRRFRMTRA